jgi:Zn-dependent M28 family amino/carboxypeptidase
MRLRLVTALLLALAGPAAAQPSAAPAPEPIFSADRFRAHVAFLADDALEGRDTGSRGEAAAAAYVASQFMALGLRPGGENGGWYQQVRFRSARLTGGALTISGAARARAFANGSDVILFPSLTAGQSDVTAAAVFAGYGLDAPAQGVDDYAGLDVRGKIVVLLAGMPSGLPSETGAYLGDQKAAMAARRGALGVVMVYTDPFAAMVPWAVAVPFGAQPAMTWLDAAGTPHLAAPGADYAAFLNDPAATLLFDGAPRSYAQVRAEAARAGARPRGFALAARIRLQRNSAWAATASRQVIGLLPGADPALRAEHVVLMGHLDHLGLNPDAAPGADNVYNGALDNAAGIATMLEAARAFAESRARPRRSILFMANTGEEKGLLGAASFADHPTVPIGSIVAAVDLDMPMLLYDFTDVIAFGADHSTVAETVAGAARQMGVAVSPDPMPEQSLFVRSDHYEFVKRGVPAILLATGFANGGQGRWQAYLSGPYHQVNDDLRQAIHWQAGARYARLNYLIARALADADARPLWYRGDFFGDLFAPGQPRAERPRAAGN